MHKSTGHRQTVPTDNGNVDNGKWLATIDVEGTTTEEDISRGGKGKVTWVARGGTSGTTEMLAALGSSPRLRGGCSTISKENTTLTRGWDAPSNKGR